MALNKYLLLIFSIIFRRLRRPEVFKVIFERVVPKDISIQLNNLPFLTHSLRIALMKQMDLGPRFYVFYVCHQFGLAKNIPNDGLETNRSWRFCSLTSLKTENVATSDLAQSLIKRTTAWEYSSRMFIFFSVPCSVNDTLIGRSCFSCGNEITWECTTR